MDFSKMLEQGKRTALRAEKDNVLVTFQANRKLRDEANRKVANLSDYLRRCLEKLAQSDIDKQTRRIQDEIIKEVLDGK